MDRCDHTDLPAETCAHCRPAPAPAPVKTQPKRQPAKCGTRGGYSRHRRLGEPYCQPCRIANTEANRRLSQTGTSRLPGTKPAPAPAPAPARKEYKRTPITRPAGPDNWREQGACAKEDPDLHFPEGTTGRHLLQAEKAKAMCRRCPVMETCGAWALATREPYGIFGGLDENERRAILRTAQRRSVSPAEAAARKTSQPHSLQDIFDAGTTLLHGGHLAWTGKTQIRFDGRVYTPRQLCFFLDRGHASVGRVMSDCNVSECVLPQHLADTAERSRTGAAEAAA
jgi:WhiB family redox-sensing transcriptional regulator